MALATPSTAFAGNGSGVDFDYYNGMLDKIAQDVQASCNNQTIGDARAAIAANTVKLTAQVTARYTQDVDQFFKLTQDPKVVAQARFEAAMRAQRDRSQLQMLTLESRYDHLVTQRMPASVSADALARYNDKVANVRHQLRQAKDDYAAATRSATAPQSMIDQVTAESLMAQQNLPRMTQIGNALDVNMTKAQGCLSQAQGRSQQTVPSTGDSRANAMEDFQNAQKFEAARLAAAAGSDAKSSSSGNSGNSGKSGGNSGN